MTITFRPAVRENTPLIIGIAGPTKSGKTYSALRIASGIANGGPIAMLNAEGPRGHQYAEKFKYVTCDLTPPFRPTSYTEALEAAAKITPAVVIIDSASHMHDGPGGVLEWHEEELDRMAGDDFKKRDRSTFAAWVKPKAAENQFIYAMLGMKCPVILCFRAKEKIKLVRGQEPIELGWQPIAGERVAFETIFTLMLPPHSKGVPDLAISDMREPFDTLVPKNTQLDERLGKQLAAWAKGGHVGAREADRDRRDPAQGTEATAGGPQRTAESGAPVARTDSPEDDRASYIARIESSATPARITILCNKLFRDPNIDWRQMDMSALKTLHDDATKPRSA